MKTTSKPFKSIINTIITLLILLNVNFLVAHEGFAFKSSQDQKGLFSIQFSWNKESYDDKTSIEIEYKRKSFLSKTKASGKTALYARKNQFINLELKEGVYELTAIKIRTPTEIYGYYLRVPIEEEFTVKAGEITNGGMIFLVKENKNSKSVMTLKLDNTADVKQYVNVYMPTYQNKIKDMNQAWSFISKEKTNKMISSFANSLVKNENRNPRENLRYMRTTLGMVFKMTQDESNTIVDYKLIPTPSYQEIIEMKILKDGKLLCVLENGSFLYGDDEGLDFIPLPRNLENVPELHFIKGGRFLLVDNNFNIFSADNTFKWKEQLNFRRAQKVGGLFTQQPISYPKIYKGKQHLYIYSPRDDKDAFLLQSGYNDISFTSVQLSKEIKVVPMVTETTTHLFIGPHLKLNATAKRPGYLYIKELSGSNWLVRELPRGDCKRFYPGKDQSILYTECSKNNWFESRDYGQSWSKWEAAK